MKRRYSAVLLAALLLTGCGVRRESGSRTEAARRLFGRDSADSAVKAEAAPQESSKGTDNPQDDSSGTKEPENSEPDPRRIFGQQQQPQTDPPIKIDYSACYTLTADNSGLVRRSVGAYDSDGLTWVIEFNDRIVLERNAEDELSYRPMNYGNGIVRVWLKAWIDGKYEIVSNTVEYEQSSGSASGSAADDSGRKRIQRLKSDLKNRVRHFDGCEYKRGFIIDPDHDGICNGIAFYAGRDENGVLQQIIKDCDSDRTDIYFDRSDYVQQGNDCTLGIWCDPETKTDYIVRIDEDGTVYDCYTDKPLYEYRLNDNFYSYDETEPYNCDRFYVSVDGVPHEEDA